MYAIDSKPRSETYSKHMTCYSSILLMYEIGKCGSLSLIQNPLFSWNRKCDLIPRIRLKIVVVIFSCLIESCTVVK